MDHTKLLETLRRRIEKEPLRRNVALALIAMESKPEDEALPVLERIIATKAEECEGRFDLIPVGEHLHGLIVLGEPHVRRQMLSGIQDYANDHHSARYRPITYSVASAAEARHELRKVFRFQPEDEDLALLTLRIAEASLEVSATEEVIHDIVMIAKRHPEIKFVEWEQLKDFPEVNARVTHRMRNMLPLSQILHLRRLGRDKWAEKIDQMNSQMVNTELNEYFHTARSKSITKYRLFTLIATIYVATDDDGDEDTFF